MSAVYRRESIMKNAGITKAIDSAYRHKIKIFEMNILYIYITE
jgi:hypothetical protein